ncbi:MAG: hypothetical protein BWY47_00929 [Bacteroidetes bacterium ADurb.Bin302]|nr:MAG: hypothetical protein BWY47_00929 [Bacteroidetes bacterium ADurb.Bin302]
MIYLTGDIHGDITIFTPPYFPQSHMMTENDYVIQLGDFGCFWKNPPSKEEIENLKFFDKQQYTTLFIDGNHENFPLLYSYPVVDFMGGKAHKINDHLYHLMRGNVYMIDGKKFFTFGGGLSIDKKYRIPGISWWKEEYPSKTEEKHALMTLEQHNFHVDYVLTHAAPLSILEYMIDNYMFKPIFGEEKTNDYVSKFLEYVFSKITFDHWYFGHYHFTGEINSKFTALYQHITRLGTFVN